MNPPYAFNGSRGGGGMAYIAMVNTRDSTQGMVKIWETAIAIRHGNQLARPSWDIVNPSFDELEKEAVVPKEVEYPRRTGHSCRPAGPLLRTDMANQGFFILLRWLIGFFRPLHQQGFLPVNL